MLEQRIIRGKILNTLYDLYQDDPLATITPNDIVERSQLTREQLRRNIYYLEDRGYVECLKSFGCVPFAGARITPDGIDVVEDKARFERLFGPLNAGSEWEELRALIEKLSLSRFDYGVDTDRVEINIMLLEHELERSDEISKRRMLNILAWLREDFGEGHSIHTVIEKIAEQLRMP